MRCEDCPSDMDEGLYERLREWRAEQATAQRAARLLRLHRQDADGDRGGRARTSEGELARIPGVGVRKLDRYGADVLAICAGQEARGATSDGD